jgi:hypothetical protein
MKSRLRLGSLVFGFICLAVACSSEEETGDAQVSVSLENFAELYAEQFCRLQEPCCEAAGGEWDAGCVEWVQTHTQDAFATRLAVQNVEFNQAGAEACIAELESLDGGCAETWKSKYIAACGEVIRGTLGAGEECESADQCARPANGYVGCLEFGDETVTRCRQFNTTAEVGEECLPDAEIFAGDEGSVVQCSYETGGCVEGTCAARGETGDECDYLTCGSGLTCFMETEGEPRTCVAELEEGDSCEVGGEVVSCEFATRCQDGTCTLRPLVVEFAGDGTSEPGCNL